VPARHALVVDDSISVRRLATRQLQACGFEVEEAADGLEALHRLRTKSFDLVLTDLEMPRMDGFELLAELGRSPLRATVPVLVASTRSDLHTRQRALALGAFAFLEKPVAADALDRVLGALGPASR
jgi:CheY-like chemotaxis protein